MSEAQVPRIVQIIKSTADTIEVMNNIAQQIKKLAVMFEKHKAESKEKHGADGYLGAIAPAALEALAKKDWYAELTNPILDQAPDKLAAEIKIVTEMVTFEIDLNAKDANGDTLLHKLAAKGSAEAVMALMAAGAKGDIKNAEGKTALEVARANENIEVITALHGGQKALMEKEKVTLEPQRSGFVEMVASMNPFTLGV